MRWPEALSIITLTPSSNPCGMGGKKKYTLDAYFPDSIPFLGDKRRKYSVLLGHFLFNNSHLLGKKSAKLLNSLYLGYKGPQTLII